MQEQIWDINGAAERLGWSASVIRKYDDAMKRAGGTDLTAYRGARNARVFRQDNLDVLKRMRELVEADMTVDDAARSVLVERGVTSVGVVPVEAHADAGSTLMMVPVMEALARSHQELGGKLTIIDEQVAQVDSRVALVDERVLSIAQNQQHFESQHQAIYEAIQRIEARNQQLEEEVRLLREQQPKGFLSGLFAKLRHA